MTSLALDSSDSVTVSDLDRNQNDSLISALTAARQDVLDEASTEPDEVIGATLRALEHHLPCVSLPDILELRVLIDTDATDPESAFVDTTEQALEHLDSWP